MTIRKRVRAVLLDVDGTLYHQTALRALMALELSSLPFAEGSLRSAGRIIRVLRTFRRVREELRELGEPREALLTLQFSRTAERSGTTADFVERTVNEWIYRRPLKYLKPCRRRAVGRFLAYLSTHRAPAGAFSDYPVDGKIDALGWTASIGPKLCATDPEINAFKPHPKGFLRAAMLWGLAPSEILYVGDRFEVDGAGARAAGMSCAILGKEPYRAHANPIEDCFFVSSFKELKNALSDSFAN